MLLVSHRARDPFHHYLAEIAKEFIQPPAIQEEAEARAGHRTFLDVHEGVRLNLSSLAVTPRAVAEEG